MLKEDLVFQRFAFNYGQPGHFARNCPHLGTQNTQGVVSQSVNQPYLSSEAEKGPSETKEPGSPSPKGRCPR